MTLSREQIEKVFTAFLNRAPESESVFVNNRDMSFEEYVERVVFSSEFQARFISRIYSELSKDLRPLSEERIVFIHIPKCGGTTLHNLLSSWYGNENIHPERHNGLYYCAASNLAGKKVFSGHYDYYSSGLIPGNKKRILFLRDPKERLISLYNFHRAHRREVIDRENLQLARWANEYDIDSYFLNEEIRSHPAVNNTFARYLSNRPQLMFRWESKRKTPSDDLQHQVDEALTNLRSFLFIGFLEDYDQSVTELARCLGKTVNEHIEKRQVLDDLMETNPGMKKIVKQRPKESTLEAMNDLTAYDYKVYFEAKRISTTVT